MQTHVRTYAHTHTHTQLLSRPLTKVHRHYLLHSLGMESLQCFQAVSTHKSPLGIDSDVGWLETELRLGWRLHLRNGTKTS